MVGAAPEDPERQSESQPRRNPSSISGQTGLKEKVSLTHRPRADRMGPQAAVGSGYLQGVVGGHPRPLHHRGRGAVQQLQRVLHCGKKSSKEHIPDELRPEGS